MRKILSYFLLSSFTLLSGINVVDAACSYTDKAALNKIAANVKVNYETLSEKKDMTAVYGELEGGGASIVDMEYINLNIYNISSEVYVEATNTTTGEVKNYDSSQMVNGAITERFEDLSYVRKYIFKVYGSNTSSCPGESLKTIRLTLPKFNEFSTRSICTENPDFYLCKEFTTLENIDEEEFETKYQYYSDKKINDTGKKVEKEDPWYTKGLNFIADNKYYLAGGALLIVAGIVVIKRIKSRDERKLGL